MNAEKTVSFEKRQNDCGKGGRRIFFLDIENYAGKALLDADDVVAVRESVERQFEPGVEDLVVIGTSGSRNFVAAALGWHGPRHVLKRGHDGADLALLDAIDDYRLETFDSVYLMSGDGIFADRAGELADGGVDVTVVSRPGSLSWRLIKAAPYLLAA